MSLLAKRGLRTDIRLNEGDNWQWLPDIPIKVRGTRLRETTFVTPLVHQEKSVCTNISPLVGIECKSPGRQWYSWLTA